MKTFTKSELIQELRKVRALGWVKSLRSENDGGVGNTLEGLLGIDENNLPIADAIDWELKAQRLETKSLLTLFHVEPSPREEKFVPYVFLPVFGWRHQNAGKKYPKTERSFRQTVNAQSYTDRGFRVTFDKKRNRVGVEFNPNQVDQRHADWLGSVLEARGPGRIEPEPYWDLDELFEKASTKLRNCILVRASSKRIERKEWFHFQKILMLSGLSKASFIQAIADGDVLIDFDARTGHNHGTKFRLRQSRLAGIYEKVEEL